MELSQRTWGAISDRACARGLRQGRHTSGSLHYEILHLLSITSCIGHPRLVNWIHADGFEWNGRRSRSLTIVAREITGAHWSGPRFFSLRNRAGPIARRVPNPQQGE